ncbi:MAG: serine hydrolase [Anaerolineales bacterium]|nr:serine hydrolase [Anaerolineales bacterium]
MKTKSTKIFRIIGVSIVVLIGFIAIWLLSASLTYSSEYVRRVIAWGESDLNDYLYNFPYRSLDAAPEPFIFDEDPDPLPIAETFESILQIKNLESFLEETNTQSFIVIQDDKILYEKYFNNARRDSMMTSFSVAKSFTSALVGIAIGEGYIESVDDSITLYLPELIERDPRFEDITIRHLLLMASGLNYQEMRFAIFNGDDPLTTYYTDQREAALEFTNINDPPGEYFNYNKYHPQLLGLILERATGSSVTDYLQEKIWDPIGMEFEGSWSLDSEDSGFEKMEAGINARAIDFAKFGRLYLQSGEWNGTPVISRDWIAESTQVERPTHSDAYYPDEFGQTIYNDLEGYYKYMWYGYFRDGDEYDLAAEGDHGQFIYVSPSKNLIIVRNGLEYGIPWHEWVELFYTFASDL